MDFEIDRTEFIGGVRHGRTLGSPVAVLIHNTEWPKWRDAMDPEPRDDLDAIRATGRGERLTRPRPGHTDLVGALKYGFDDVRDALERSSARETAARVAAGSLAKMLLSHLGCSVLSHVVRIGAVAAPDRAVPVPGDLARIDGSEVRVLDSETEIAMVEHIKLAAREGDSLGGIVEVVAHGVPIGLGSHVHWDRKIDALIAMAVMSIQAVKGVEIGDAFATAAVPGSAAHDAISWNPEAERFTRSTDRAGGTEGGITNGEPVVVRAAMKPLATLNRPVLGTVDVLSKEETVSFKERTDVTAVPAMGVVAESMVALVLAAEAQRKFGGDSLAEMVRNFDAFTGTISG
jgi:chorismate synthase